MPLDKDFRNQLIPIFKAEAKDYLQALNRDLLALEKNPEADETRQRLAEIFRAAHSLKGSSHAVGLENISTLAHSLETLFGCIQRGEVKTTPETFDLAYQALDLIGSQVQSADTDMSPVDISPMCARLESIGGENRKPLIVTLPPQPEVPADVSGSEPVVLPPPPLVSESLLPPVPEPSPRADALAEETVRVAVGKLDALLEQAGELQVTRIGTEPRLTEACDMLEQIEEWEANWRRVRPTFRKLLPAFEADGDGRGAAAPAKAELKVLFEFLESNETRLHEARTKLTELLRQLEADSRRMAQVTTDLQDDVLRTRMMPAASVFDAFPRIVRDLARELDKQVALVTEGGETELDRSVLEQIKAPLLHLLRNCVDHGIESPAQRKKAGKPREGTITLSAAQRGNSIVIQVADDGAGIDPTLVKASTVKRGILTAEVAQTMSDREALWLIFRSGVSTRAIITGVSGRGVGMDVVRKNIERLQGVIDLESEIGKGTRVSLNLPLTVATTLCLLAGAGGETFAISLMNIEHIVRVAQDDIAHAQGREVIHDEGRPVLLASLSNVLEIPSAGAPDPRAKKYAIILASAEKRAAVLVDTLVGAQELVSKRLPRPFVRVCHASGATILGTGDVVVVLNVADLLRSATRVSPRCSAAPPAAPESKGPAVILVADDSITTRTLEKNILEAAGYQVRVAADGLEAWTTLQSDGIAPTGAISLLVSDINMPRMDGFELTEKIRADERLKNLPVILVTALAAREDRERGIQVGADAYIVKSSFDQDTLLATTRQLI